MMRHCRILFMICTFIAFCFLFGAKIFPQDKYTADDAPGELSKVHYDSPGLKNCLTCHTDELEADPRRCLKCHTEIAQRISASRGYHRDKAEDCAACHIEHQGKNVRLIALDTEDFDHAETGFSFVGAHEKIKDCRLCHRKDNTLPRKTTQSFLLRDPGCLSCHQSPHPGRQEVCLSCHTQKDWLVDIWDRRGLL